jgi:hypothetical protein
MVERPPHDQPEVEAALRTIERMGDSFALVMRREGRVYGRIHFMPGDPDGASVGVDEDPRRPELHAAQLIRWATRLLEQSSVELPVKEGPAA